MLVKARVGGRCINMSVGRLDERVGEWLNEVNNVWLGQEKEG